MGFLITFVVIISLYKAMGQGLILFRRVNARLIGSLNRTRKLAVPNGNAIN